MENVIWTLNFYFPRNGPQFNLIINRNNPSIQVSGYLGLDTWILILSNYPMFGYMDSWISQFFMYPDTWIHGYLDIMDTWIFKLFQYLDNGQPKKLGYPSIRIPHPYIGTLGQPIAPKLEDQIVFVHLSVDKHTPDFIIQILLDRYLLVSNLTFSFGIGACPTHFNSDCTNKYYFLSKR